MKPDLILTDPNTYPCVRSGCGHPRSAHSSRVVEQLVCAPCGGAACVPFGESAEIASAAALAELRAEIEDQRERAEKAEAKLQRVRDWIRFSANSDGGIVAEIDHALARDGEG